MQEVLRTGDPVRAFWAIATLAGAGIEAVLADLNTHMLEGSGVAIPRRVLTASEDVSRARWVLETNNPMKQAP
jgi:hypothetical protein